METDFESAWPNLTGFPRYAQMLVLDLVELQIELYPSIPHVPDKLSNLFVPLLSHL